MSDSAVEKQYKFSLESSLHKASQALMLEGYNIHVTKSVRPEPQQMKGRISQCTCSSANLSVLFLFSGLSKSKKIDIWFEWLCFRTSVCSGFSEEFLAVL